MLTLVLSVYSLFVFFTLMLPYTVKVLVSGHPRNAKKLFVTEAGGLR